MSASRLLAFFLVMAGGLFFALPPTHAQESLGPNANARSILASLEALDKAVFEQKEREEAAQAALEEIRAKLIESRREERQLREKLEVGKSRLKGRIRALYMYSGKGFVNALLSQSGTPHDVMVKVRYLLYVIDRDISLFREHAQSLEKHQNFLTYLESQERDLQIAAGDAEKERLTLEEERAKRQELLMEIQSREDLRAQAAQEMAQVNLRLDQKILDGNAALAARAPALQNPSSSPMGAGASNLGTAGGNPPGGAVPGASGNHGAANGEALQAQNTGQKATPASVMPSAGTNPATNPPDGAQKNGATGTSTQKPQGAGAKTAVAALEAAPPSAFEIKRGRHIFPTTGKITRGYGRYKVEGMLAPAFSKGLEIKAPMGTPFKAIASGEVQMADWFKGYGLMIIVNHGNDYRSIYTHASKLLVKAGDQVKPGDIIGLVGDTGSLKGPYLYLELRRGKSPINPMEWLRIPPHVLQLQ